MIEGIVGVMTSVVTMPVDKAYEKLRWYSETQGQNMPSWCTERFVAAAAEQMRRLQGQWKATPYGEAMEIVWPETGQGQETA
jgi:hypothetical protein